jgi:hypothetical protein
MAKSFRTDVVLGRKRYKQADDADKKQLGRELEDLRFLIDQWPPDIRGSRDGQGANGKLPAIPARPCLTIDTLRDPIAHVAAEAQQTDLGPEIVAADDFAGLVGPIDDTEIELREGLVRKIQRESDARDARNWAADRARKAGRGFYLVMTRYVSTRSRDQEVYIDRLYNQGTVRLDPRHEKADGSDAKWEFWGSDLSWEDYDAMFPDRPSKKTYGEHGDDSEWRGLGDEAPEWFTQDGETRSVRVMNYLWTDYTKVKMAELADGRRVPAKEAGKAPRAVEADGQPVEDYTDVTETIIFAKIDGVQVLEETVWPSKYMPLVKVLWEEVQPYDEQRRVQGMVRPARDPAFGVSVMATTEVEVALLAPKTPVTGLAGQFEGFTDAWDQANVRNIGRLEYNGYTAEYPIGSGAPLPPPQALQRNTEAAVGTWDGLREMFVRAVKSTTGVPDATLGNVDPSVRSGKAIRLLQERASQGTSGGLANLVKSVTYEAKIVNSLLYPIYGIRPGRLSQIMTGKYESQGVLIGQPFVRDEKQRPVPFDAEQHQGKEPKEYKLTEDAEFNIAIRVSKDYDTRRQEESSTLGELIGANPVLMTWFGDLFFENQDGPGHKDMAKRAKVMLDPKVLAMLNQEAGGTPPEVAAQLQALQGELEQAKQYIATEQAKQQGQVQAAQMKMQADAQAAQLKTQFDTEKVKFEAQAKVQLANVEADKELALQVMKNAASIAVAHIQAASKGAAINAHADEEAQALGHEANEAELDRGTAREARAHDAEQADIDRGHEAEQSDMDRNEARQAMLLQQQADAEQPEA